jgi:hypothetical protein
LHDYSGNASQLTPRLEKTQTASRILREDLQVQLAGTIFWVYGRFSTLARRRGRFAQPLPGAGSDSFPISIDQPRRVLCGRSLERTRSKR